MKSKIAEPDTEERVSKTFRLTPQTVNRLKEVATQQGVSQTTYLEMILRASFDRADIGVTFKR